jgi:hypothetical protein
MGNGGGEGEAEELARKDEGLWRRGGGAGRGLQRDGDAEGAGEVRTGVRGDGGAGAGDGPRRGQAQGRAAVAHLVRPHGAGHGRPILAPPAGPAARRRRGGVRGAARGRRVRRWARGHLGAARLSHASTPTVRPCTGSALARRARRSNGTVDW